MKNISPVTFIDKLIKKNELGQPFRLSDHQREILRLAFDFDSAPRFEDELVLELFVDGARHLNSVGNSARLHAARQVHCVTP